MLNFNQQSVQSVGAIADIFMRAVFTDAFQYFGAMASDKFDYNGCTSLIMRTIGHVIDIKRLTSMSSILVFILGDPCAICHEDATRMVMHNTTLTYDKWHIYHLLNCEPEWYGRPQFSNIISILNQGTQGLGQDRLETFHFTEYVPKPFKIADKSCHFSV